MFKGNFAKENTLELSILFLSSLGGLPIACVPMSHHQQRAESTLGFTLIILLFAKFTLLGSGLEWCSQCSNLCDC